jgi:hypothetical protein
MAKSGGATEATTLIFPKQSDWKEIAEAKRTAKKRAQSANGTYSSALADKVENAHMDRRAARIVLALDAIEDDEDLHVTVHHIIDGMKKLGILKRAMAQEEMFDEHKIDDEALTRAATKGARNAKAGPKGGGGGSKKGNVVSIGDAARQVAEQAGVAEAAE